MWIAMAVLLWLQTDPHTALTSRMTWDIERHSEEIKELKTKLAADSKQDERLAVLEANVKQLPTTMDVLKLLIELGLVGGVVGKGGHTLYKKRKTNGRDAQQVE